MKKITYILAILALTNAAYGKVDLATLPGSDAVQLTIYNSADLTLVRDARSLTLKEGENQLQFSWANTLIDPTSLEMTPKAQAGMVDITELSYPAGVKNLGLWKVQSEIASKVPVEITYLTSGLSWRAFYMGTLSDDESIMRLQGYVCVTNNSGEDYDNAQVRLIVGKINIIDQIAQLAQKQYAYDSPLEKYMVAKSEVVTRRRQLGLDKDADDAKLYFGVAVKKLKEVVKESLSEYFLYTIEGQESIANGWTKRLSSFDTSAIPIVNLYKYEEEQYGNNVTRFLSFKNDTEHKLGETPLPEGALTVYRNLDQQQHLSYQGQSGFKYIPVGEDVELNLGVADNIVVEPKLMKEQTENYRFDKDQNINGWDEVREFAVEIRNTRDIAVKIEIKRNFPTQYWELTNSGDCGQYEKEDLDTVKYTITLEPQSKQTFNYTLHTYQGTRQENWRP